MTIDETVSTKDLKNRLTNLASHMPGETPKVYAVAEYLATRLGDGALLPEGFVAAFQLMFIDMQRGVDGYTGKPLPENLRDPLGVAYSTASRKVPLIAEAICPKEFARLVAQKSVEYFAR